MMRDLDRAVDPAALAEAPEVDSERATPGVRGVRAYAKHPPVRPWWTCWVFARLFGCVTAARRVEPGYELLVAAAWALSALAAAQIVSRLTARLVEVARRRAALERANVAVPLP